MDDIRRERVRLRIRRVAENRYQITDLNGQGREFRKRHDCAPELRALIDGAEGRDVVVEGWLNRTHPAKTAGELIA